jgi:hypothetical protein
VRRLDRDLGLIAIADPLFAPSMPVMLLAAALLGLPAVRRHRGAHVVAGRGSPGTPD